MNTNTTQTELEAYIINENLKAEAWVAEDPENRWSPPLVTDPDHWAEYDVFTPSEFEKHMLVQDYCDAFKSKHGYRTSWDDAMACSEAQLLEKLRNL